MLLLMGRRVILIKDLFSIMEEIAPARYAADWDNVGLQIGNPHDGARGIMVALDTSLAAVKEAASKGFNLLVTHHPFLFSPVKTIDFSTPQGKIIKEAIGSGLTVFSAHTNLDSTEGGINDMLGDLLGLTETSPMEPFEGNNSAGMGRVGSVKGEKNLGEFAALVKERFNVDSIKVLGNGDKKISRIALCGGSGGSLIRLASKLGAQLYISGDISYHQAREAEDMGLSIIDPGHFSSEKIVVEGLAKILREKLQIKKIDLPVAAFCGEKEPFVVV